MRLSLLIASSVVFALASACNFEDADVKKPATEDPYAERTKNQTKLGDLDEQQLKSGSFTALSCGANDCKIGETCCVTANGPTCNNRCDNGRAFECYGSGDCGNGDVCCLEGNRATCAKSCGNNLTLCTDGSQCAAGSTCAEQRCNGHGFNVCRVAGTENRHVDCAASNDTGVVTRSDGNATPEPGPVPEL